MGDVHEESFEGRTKIVNVLRSFFEKKGFEMVNRIEEADLVHVHSGGIAPSFYVSKIKKKLGIPCIYSLYSPVEASLSDHFRSLIEDMLHYQNTGCYKWKNIMWYFILASSSAIPLSLRAKKLKEMDRVIVPSNLMQKKLFDNTEVIRLGIDTGTFKKIKQTGHEGINVNYIGHQASSKGVNDIINASLKFSDPIHVSFYFTMFTKKVLRYIHAKNPKIKVHGYTRNIVDVYNQSDIVILPYRYSLSAIANPLVLLEAMACERAIITTNLPNIKEICGDSVLYVEPYSPQQIVNAVNYLKERPELRIKLGKKARARVVNYYNQSTMLREYDNLYKEFISL